MCAPPLTDPSVLGSGPHDRTLVMLRVFLSPVPSASLATRETSKFMEASGQFILGHPFGAHSDQR
eukprot:444458-Alexandrium_andersonii.AAC.1